ncbi:MAG: hypothetical protein IJT62_04240 [Oscillospiraceae bacterium]|nr:hypothetical protein [Oscillospiraceae bacterium]
MARPRKASPEKLEETVSALIAEYQATQNVDCLTDYTVMQRLNISPRTLETYYDGEADKAILEDNNISDEDRERYTKSGYRQAIKKLVEFRRAVCVQHIATERVASGWIFLSKQPHWGGFQDVQRTESRGEQRITVCISGPDGKPLRE